MTIINKLLVLFDDNKQRTIDDVKKVYANYSKQVLASSMGRMISRNWLTKIKFSYKITSSGRNIVSLNLSHLKKLTKIPESYLYLLMFKIPEKKRVTRDIIRIFLRKNGFGQLHNSVWLSVKGSPTELDIIIDELQVKKNVIGLQIKVTSDEQKMLVNNCQWNFNELNNLYKNFIKLASNYLKKNQKDAVIARNLVYEYSLIVRQDPLLQYIKYPQNFCGNKAKKLYKKLRKFCY